MRGAKIVIHTLLIAKTSITLGFVIGLASAVALQRLKDKSTSKPE